MSDIENPPAFPFPEIRGADGCGIREGSDGMSLRDWFAGQALAAMGTWLPPAAGDQLNADFAMRDRANWAYRHAGAMLAERLSRATQKPEGGS